MLSKSNGLTIELHSKCVSKIAIIIAKNILSNEVFNEHIEKIRLAALLHDIGKCSETFQNYVKSKSEGSCIDDILEDSGVFHHEISWAISYCIFSKKEHESMLNSIYWHHAKPVSGSNLPTNDYLSNILGQLNENEIQKIYGQIEKLIDGNLISFNEFISNVKVGKESSEKTPNYYSAICSNSLNRFNIIYRAILITADRVCSKLSVKENEKVLKDDDFANSLILNDKEIIKIILPSFYDEERKKIQIEIANSCERNKTSVVKAPAGFGKTLIGLLWSIGRRKKLLWVCPRNIFVESVYDSILSEVKNIGIEEKLSIELFLAGKRKLCTHSFIDDFQSDIVITNIDNFLAPISKNKFGVWGAEIFKRDVVFDEYHEFVCENAIFSGFIEIMRLRHQLLDCQTVLLSATPSIIHIFWDTIYNKTNVLPNSEEHYPAAHNKEYSVSFISELELKERKNSLVMTNSIFNSQMKKKELNTDILVHSDFLEEDKNEIFKYLFSCYRKGASSDFKPSVSSAPIIQASCDISFKYLFKSSLSPESDLQCIGRCNRWGEYDDSEINFFEVVTGKKSEIKAINTLYDTELYKKWVNYLKRQIENLEGKINLKNLYKIYNRFNIENQKELISFLTNKYEKSLVSLSNIEPIKINFKTKQKGKEIVLSAVTLRTNGESVFVTYRKNREREEFVKPFSVTIPKNVTSQEFFDEDEDFLRNFSKTIKNFIQTGRFDYNKRFKNKVVPSLILKWAHRESSPYVAFNKEYSKEYGLAKKSIYN